MNIQNWQILKTGRRRDFVIIIAITLIFLFVIAMNVRLIFRITSTQAEDIGQMQLEVIRNDLQGVISTAENTISQVALESERLLKSGISQDELKEIFYKKVEEQKTLTDGVCFNVYITGKDWTIIPNFDMPPEYHATERLWYKGAEENPSKIYITEPYIDAMTGEMCFTMSKILPDNETVVAIDFNFSGVQKSILQMSTTSDRKALIVTKSGMIIGYTNMSLVGEKISSKLPDYEDILNRVMQSEGNESFTAQLDGNENTIFSSKTNNGWYMILSVDNWAFYKDSYIQIIFTTILSLLMMLAIIFFYLNAMRNGLQAENALQVKEKFLSRLSHELRDPLHRILDASSLETTKFNANPADKAAEVRESALKLSDMLDNLFSFSTIVSSDKNKLEAEKIFQNKELSKVSRYSRIGVVAVLVVAMILAFGICLTTTISWGDTKMNREVDIYDHQLSNWIENQRGTLMMFVNLLSEHPELMDDYPSAVKFLDDLAKHYPEISVCYLGNPYKEHNLIMNNGWQGPSDFKVETRPWYIAAESSVSGFAISAPYLDAQTGLYCVTMSKIVWGTKGDFVGIFGIDFYIDRLTHVLDASYTKDGYAFLVDRNGVIINHPNANYQLSKSRMTDIGGTEYSKVYSSPEVVTLKDYAGNYMASFAKKNRISDFTVVVANSWWNIYGNIIILGLLFIMLLCICVAIVHVLINRLLNWQASVNRQLKVASDTALAASQAKSQFLAQMSHEIRTPINAILGMNEMILRESYDKEILNYASNIQSAGRTLLTLINSILDFSKIEDGKMEIVPVRYETVTLIDDLVNMISEKAYKKGLQFKTEIDSTLPKSLYGDDVRLRQVVTNILTNAVKYTPEGSVTLSMSGREIDTNVFELQVKVRDTGIGIRAEDIGKLFQSFQRLDEERNRNIEGTGLGIAIVQKLLSMMDSKLEVASEYSHGSEFSFTLRQKVIDHTPIGNYGDYKRKHKDTLTTKKFLTATNAKILAVDDNDMNLKVISGLLKRNHIVPDLAESGQQGIEFAKKNFYHIIFMDNMMPVMSGIETLQIMRRDKILSDKTKVVMLTAGAIAGMREIYLHEGFDDYLSKPIDVSELEAILERHLPAEIVSFKSEEEKKFSEPTTQIEQTQIEELEEVIGENEFSRRERKFFAETCPDIDLDTALKYCMDSKSFLIQMLKTFTNAKRAEKIQSAFDAKDVKNYQILVHALKSTSLSIGAKKLSELAKALELATKDNRLEEVKANHAGLMTSYKNVRKQIMEYLSGADK
ncbi:MAG: response regulator [Quinella sp. 1Q5]|nr:response regulator [Quinella sp. 1Q5]